MTLPTTPVTGQGVKYHVTEEANIFNGKPGRGSFCPLWVILAEEGTAAPGHALWVLDRDGLLLEVPGPAMGLSAAGAGSEPRPFSEPGSLLCPAMPAPWVPVPGGGPGLQASPPFCVFPGLVPQSPEPWWPCLAGKVIRSVIGG